MRFKIMSEVERPCYAGQLIAYRIRIAPMLWMGWLTEITACDPGKYFIDEQRRGPYKLWHHRHQFEEIDDGKGGKKVRMTDTVTYQLRGGPIGSLMHAIWIRKQLEGIFSLSPRSLSQVRSAAYLILLAALLILSWSFFVSLAKLS